MKKQVLVNIDPFDIKDNTVRFAVGIARKLDLPLLLYSVYNYPVMPVAPEMGARPVASSKLLDRWLKEIEIRGKAYCDEIKAIYPNTRFECEAGMLADQLVDKTERLQESASKHSPLLLISPKTNAHNWWNDIIGTAETAIAAQVPCPVLFVPENARYSGISRIMYLADLVDQDGKKTPGYHFLKSFARSFSAALVVAFLANVVESESQSDVGAIIERMKRSLPFEVQQEFRFMPGLAPKDILEIAELSHTDILAFPFRETSVFERFFSNEVTRTLLLKTETPVLVF
ncbi:MAG: hypothetical protein R3D58_05100 [Saprospiraceae bacterium]|jgi:nucleotide-binding universal stress UspA family protein|nr:hypothetical protein [Lewinellaceae bacterium]